MLSHLRDNLNFKKFKLFEILIFIFPAALISGPLIPEIIVFIFSVFILIKLISEKKFHILKNKVILMYLFFLLTICLASFISDHFLSSSRSSFLHLRFALFTLAIIYIIEAADKNFYNFFLYSILITLFFLISFAFIQFFFYETSFLNIQSIDSKRMSSFFGDEKILGGYLLRLLPLILYLIFKINLDKKLGALILIFILLGIIISGERTSVILSIIMLSLLFFINFDIKKKIAFLTILTFFVLLFFFFNENLYERLILETYNDIFNTSNKISSFNIFSTGHTYYYITSLKMFFDNPILGIGPNLFRLLCSNPEYGLGINIDNCSTHPHNYYLQLLAETGILGFIFLISLFTWISINIFKYIFRIKLIETYKYCLLISVFINIFPISSHGNFFNNWNSMIIFFSLPFLLKEFNLISFKK